jgi:hypothetical protein
MCHPNSATNTVISHPKVYISYWNSRANDPNSSFPFLESYFGGIGGSNQGFGIGGSRWMGVVAQYSTPNQTINNDVGILKGTWVDTSAVPAAPVEGDYQAAAIRAATNFGVLTDPDAIIVIATGPSTTYTGPGCSVHRSAPNGSNPQVAYIDLPYLSNFAPCGGTVGGGNDNVSLMIHHELMEAITDPRWEQGCPMVGWIDNNGGEIADKGNKINRVPLTNTSYFMIVDEWSNDIGAPSLSFANWEHEFYQSSSNTLVHRRRTLYPVAADSGYVDLGAEPSGRTLASAPASASWGNSPSGERVDAFFVDSGSHIGHAYTENGTNFSWDDWSTVPIQSVYGVSVASPKPYRVDVFGVGAGSPPQLTHRSWDNTADSGWQVINFPSSDYYPGPGAGIGSVAWTLTSPSDANNNNTQRRVDLFYLNGASPPSLKHLYSLDNGNTYNNWDDWGNPGGWNLQGTPNVASWRDGRLDVFVSNTAGHLMHHYWDASGSSGWDDWGVLYQGIVGGTVGACSRGDLKLTAEGVGYQQSIMLYQPFSYTWDNGAFNVFGNVSSKPGIFLNPPGMSVVCH